MNYEQLNILADFEQSIELLASLKILIKNDKITIEGQVITTKQRKLIKDGLPYVIGALKRQVRMLKIEWKQDNTEKLKDKMKDFIHNIFYRVKSIIKP